MSIDCHIKIDGIKGESVYKDHKDEIDVLGWTWGASNPTNMLQGSGGGSGKGVPNDFTFLHNYDLASPLLAKKCADGSHIPQVKVTVRKAGEGQKDFLTVTLKTVIVSAIHPSANSSGDIAEEVALTYRDIEFEYKAQDDKGALGGGVKFGWDVKTMEIR